MVSVLLTLVLSGCLRPSDVYDVGVYGEGTQLDELAPPATAMGGQIEITRMRLYGTNLGYGLAGFGSDWPRADGADVVTGYGFFGYPKDPGFDRNSGFVSPGPGLVDGTDACLTRIQTSGYLGVSEYVDVGDHIELSLGDGDGRIVLERDPPVHPRPAGESWFAGYGGTLMPVVQDHERLPDTWRGGETWDVRFPGTVLPPESTMGAVPYPLKGASLRFPTPIEGLTWAGEPVAAPDYYWAYDNGAEEWIQRTPENDADYAEHPEFGDPVAVRHAAPWAFGQELRWTPAEDKERLTLVFRWLGKGNEGACGCDADCGEGFSCTERGCMGDDGATWSVLGEVACTVVDDGQFWVTPELFEDLASTVDPARVQGAVVGLARMSNQTTDVPPVRSFNNRKIDVSPVRLRAIDVTWTRLEAP